MKAGKSDLIRIANLYLDNLFINNLNKLDLLCEYDDLSNDWLISYEKNEKDSNNNYIMINQLRKDDVLVAEYKLILTNNMEFIDEFFITY